MKLTIVGIAIVGYGTYLTFTDKWKVAGVALIGVGTFLIAVAQRLDSTSDRRRVEAKLAEVRQEIASAMALPSKSASAQRLEEIDQSFKDWAASLIRNKERGKLEVEQARLAGLKARLDRSEEWRPVLELFLDTVRRAMQAYSSATGEILAIKLPPLPHNLYDKSVQYSGHVSFPKGAVWFVELDRDSPRSLLEFPVLWVSLAHGRDKGLLAQLWSMNRTSEFVRLSIHGEFLPTISGLEPAFTRDNYQEGLPKVVKGLVEAQILALESRGDRR